MGIEIDYRKNEILCGSVFEAVLDFMKFFLMGRSPSPQYVI